MLVRTKIGLIRSVPCVIVDGYGKHVRKTAPVVNRDTWVAVPCSNTIENKETPPSALGVFNWKEDKIPEEDFMFLWGCLIADKYSLRIEKKKPYIKFAVRNEFEERVVSVIRAFGIRFVFTNKEVVHRAYEETLTYVEVNSTKLVRLFMGLGIIDVPDVTRFSKKLALSFLKGYFAKRVYYLEGKTVILPPQHAYMLQKIFMYLGVIAERTKSGHKRRLLREVSQELLDLLCVYMNPNFSPKGYGDFKDLIPNHYKQLHIAFMREKKDGNVANMLEIRKHLPPQLLKLKRSRLKELMKMSKHIDKLFKPVLELGYFYDQIISKCNLELSEEDGWHYAM